MSKEMRYPKFLETLKVKYMASACHVFILHMNLRDYVPIEGYPTIRDYIPQFLKGELGIDEVIEYSRTGGLMSQDLSFEDMINPDSEGKKDALTSRINRARRQGEGKVVPPERALPLLENLLKEAKTRRGVIIDYAENLFCDRHGSEISVNAETFLRLAVDKEIEEKNHILIVLTHNDKDLDKRLLSLHNRIISVLVPFPEKEEREAYINTLLTARSYRLKETLTPAVLANLTSGLRLWDIEDLFLEARHKEEEISEQLIKDQKKEIIRSMSQGMLEVIDPENGLEAVGGLEHIIKYTRSVVNALNRGDKKEAPVGVLFLGPPGTGKSLVAKAMAKEAGFNFVEIKNVRDMWVGASERNLSFVLNLIRALSPCCVFMDELDQGEGSRGTNLDSGVGKRIFGELLKVMSDETLLGKVLWIGASNRPDLVDSAMKRPGRFDDKCVFLPPSTAERSDIFEKMFKRYSIPYDNEVRFEAIAHKTEGFTGAEIELVVKRAYKRAKERGIDRVGRKDLDSTLDDFIPSKDAESYEFMTLLALREINSWSMLPEPLHPWLEPYINISKKQIDAEKLETRLSQLKVRCGNGGT